MTDIRPLSEIYEELGEAWVDADAAANLLEDCKSAFLSNEKLKRYPDLASNRAETLVKASSEWKEYVEQTVEARRKANLLKIKLETIRMRHSEWVAQDANQRMAAKL